MIILNFFNIYKSITSLIFCTFIEIYKSCEEGACNTTTHICN